MSTDIGIHTIVEELAQALEENTLKYTLALQDVIIRLMKEKQSTIASGTRCTPYKDHPLGLVSTINKEVSEKTSISECDHWSLGRMLAALPTGNRCYSLKIVNMEIVLRTTWE